MSKSVKSKYINLLIAFLLGISLSVTAQVSDQVLINVTAESKKAGFIKGLKSDDFKVTIGGTLQKITSFSSEDEPCSIGILLDISGSMGAEPNLRKHQDIVLEALKQFVRSSREENEYFVVAFNTEAFITGENLRSREAAIRSLDRLRAAKSSGNTRFYDALAYGLEKISRSPHKKRVLLIVSDGVDTGSETSLNKLKQEVKESGTLLYLVGRDESASPSIYPQQAMAFKDDLTALGGGKSFYYRKPTEIGSIIQKIAAELRNQYTVVLTPDGGKTGKWNKLKVEITVPEEARKKVGKIAVRHREGFIL